MIDSDIFICEAFRQILVSPAAEVEEKLTGARRMAIANYLMEIPQGDKLDPEEMADHIAAFCELPGNEDLERWLGENYDRLDPEGINQIVKKTGDPGDEADAPPKQNRPILSNEGRDICEELQRWAREERDKQSKGGSQNVSNSN
ncbi:MAG: hypothetical protein F6J93_34270 [Oscillatoria sp. SIO1A7]|nr:hypothetical protein [Oscillatoria sp. SIO1A7]